MKPGFESSSSGKLQVLGPDRDSSSGRIGGVLSHGGRDGGALRKPHWQADDRWPPSAASDGEHGLGQQPRRSSGVETPPLRALSNIVIEKSEAAIADAAA